jgi:peptidylprolyl isomerase
MDRKSMNIAILLVVVIIAILVVLAFFGLGSFFPKSASPQQAGDQASAPVNPILQELRDTGTVADLRTEDVAPGTGEPVKAGDSVTVNYTGVLPDGTVFDSSRDAGRTPFSFVIGAGQVIQGWERGVAGMKVGGRRLLVIPPSLGYGATGVGKIPPNSTLIFDVELLSVDAK